MKQRAPVMVPAALLLALTWTLQAAGPERIRLYTDPDPSEKGGITGRIILPELPARQILAIPADEPRLVYEGKLEEGNRFSFSGLPMRKYDLVVVFDERFYEGLNLHRESDSLTAEDRKKIKATVDQSEPYFTAKIIHRLEGTTGKGNTARAICTFVREKPSNSWVNEVKDGGFVRKDFRRTFKIVLLKDVGPGWQITRARDLYPIWVTDQAARPKHFFHRSLSRIRVTDYVKELGNIDLNRP